MNRRSFLHAVVIAPIVAALNPTPAPVVEHIVGEEFAYVVYDECLPFDWSGIPYHQSNASTRQWLGIMRSS